MCDKMGVLKKTLCSQLMSCYHCRCYVSVHEQLYLVTFMHLFLRDYDQPISIVANLRLNDTFKTLKLNKKYLKRLQTHF